MLPSVELLLLCFVTTSGTVLRLRAATTSDPLCGAGFDWARVGEGNVWSHELSNIGRKCQDTYRPGNCNLPMETKKEHKDFDGIQEDLFNQIMERSKGLQDRLAMRTEALISCSEGAFDSPLRLINPGPKSKDSSVKKICRGWAHGDPLTLSDAVRLTILTSSNEDSRRAQNMIEKHHKLCAGAANDIERQAGLAKIRRDTPKPGVGFVFDQSVTQSESMDSGFKHPFEGGVEFEFFPVAKRTLCDKADQPKEGSIKRLKWSGYQDVNYRLRDRESGQALELQVHNCHVLAAKDDQGHTYYETERDITRAENWKWDSIDKLLCSNRWNTLKCSEPEVTEALQAEIAALDSIKKVEECKSTKDDGATDLDETAFSVLCLSKKSRDLYKEATEIPASTACPYSDEKVRAVLLKMEERSSSIRIQAVVRGRQGRLRAAQMGRQKTVKNISKRKI